MYHLCLYSTPGSYTTCIHSITYNTRNIHVVYGTCTVHIIDVPYIYIHIYIYIYVYMSPLSLSLYIYIYKRCI